ncbi:hypothetical protein [Corynebacterium timonense]|uniref:Uncharacterized protein n=1 Tax=Corynebacterium timonense TaxID=441500 RepID=A0A1H1UCJ5_9CORY|nr:hypothetical protein [Corynebacterium timonense]SDS69639.1 hypothetical protein SAMN04488539_2192 [Corynebacterium timonense]
MKLKKALVAALATTTIVSAAPAANAQIVAPEPSSRIQIPGDIVDFFDGLTPINRFETEQALKIGAAAILINSSIGIISSLILIPLRLAGSSL